MSNRFAEAIKRIVEPLIPQKGSDDPPKEKPTVAGNRAIAYQEADGSTGVATGTPGVSQAPGTATGTGGLLLGGSTVAGDAATEARQGDAQGSNQNDPTKSIRSTSQGTYHADNLLNGQGPSQSEGGESSTTGTTSYGASTGDKLLGLTGLVDCDTSMPMTVRFDGLYIPPDGWETADSPPDTDSSGTTVADAVFFDCADCLQPGATYITLNSGTASNIVVTKLCFLSSDPDPTPGMFIYPGAPWILGSICYDTVYPGCGYRHADSPHYCYADAGAIGYEGMCRYGYTWDGSSCVLDDSAAALWPPSGSFQLSLGTSGFAPHPKDGEVPETYATPSAVLRACTEAGATIEITPLRNGGFAFYELVAGVPSGVIQIFRADKTLSGYTDKAGLDMLLPY